MHACTCQREERGGGRSVHVLMCLLVVLLVARRLKFCGWALNNTVAATSRLLCGICVGVCMHGCGVRVYCLQLREEHHQQHWTPLFLRSLLAPFCLLLVDDSSRIQDPGGGGGWFLYAPPHFDGCAIDLSMACTDLEKKQFTENPSHLLPPTQGREGGGGEGGLLRGDDQLASFHCPYSCYPVYKF